MASSFQFRNVNTYVVEPEGEPIQSLPSKGSLDFSPQSSCIEEAPDDGNRYARQSKSWQEVVIPANTSDLNNDSGFITDSSLTKENIVGLKLADSPEFADTQITPLAVEATYTPTVWSYLVGLFTTVPKSVKSHIVKIWERVGLLEDKYMLKYVVPVDTVAVDLTLDKYGNAFNFVEGDQFMVIIKADFPSSNRLEIRVNNISSAVYYFHTTANPTNRIIPAPAGSTIQFTESTISIVDSEIYYKLFYRYPLASGTIGGYTIGANLSSINKINIFASAEHIPTGTIIIIKKV